MIGDRQIGASRTHAGDRGRGCVPSISSKFTSSVVMSRSWYAVSTSSRSAAAILVASSSKRERTRAAGRRRGRSGAAAANEKEQVRERRRVSEAAPCFARFLCFSPSRVCLARSRVCLSLSFVWLVCVGTRCGPSSHSHNVFEATNTSSEKTKDPSSTIRRTATTTRASRRGVGVRCVPTPTTPTTRDAVRPSILFSVHH